MHTKNDHIGISIHALRKEGDVLCPSRIPGEREISIHALRKEGDLAKRKMYRMDMAFQSTPSARRATNYAQEYSAVLAFQSTPSARRATLVPLGEVVAVGISIHALRKEGD